MTYAIKAPARYAQGAGELSNLGRSAKKLGNKFLVICTDNSRGRFGAQVEASLAEQEKEVVFTTFHGEATKAEVFAKMDECRAQGCDVVVGMGGGKALDTAKAVAENLGLPCVIIPTVASNDAPCSGVAVLYNDAGVVVKAVLMRRNPDLVLVDTGIIANAPRRLFAAGLGDALSTWFEARACKNSGARTMARGNVSNTGLMMAHLCYDLLMEKGRDALAAVERHEVTPALEDVVEATICLSGLGFENGGLAAAHAVNDGFAQEPQAHGMYHGEKVAFGTLDELYAAIGYGGMSAQKAVVRVKDEMTRLDRLHAEQSAAAQEPIHPSTSHPPTVPIRGGKTSQSGIIVEGIDNCLVKFAKCCTPVPGDPVVGLITRRFGVSVHRADCPNASDAKRAEEPGRWIKVSWATGELATYQTALDISAKDRDGLTLDVAMTLSAAKVKTTSLSARSMPDGYATVSIVLEVKNQEELTNVINKLGQIQGVYQVKRASG